MWNTDCNGDFPETNPWKTQLAWLRVIWDSWELRLNILLEECLNKLLSDYFCSSPPRRWSLCSRYARPLTVTESRYSFYFTLPRSHICCSVLSHLNLRYRWNREASVSQICSFRFRQPDGARPCFQLPSCRVVIKCKLIELLLGRILLRGFGFGDTWKINVLQQWNKPDGLNVTQTDTNRGSVFFSFYTFWHVVIGKVLWHNDVSDGRELPCPPELFTEECHCILWAKNVAFTV